MSQEKRQNGASAVEYLIGLAVFVIALLTPIPPSGESAFVLLERAIKKEHSAYIYAASLPRISDDGSLTSGKKKKK